MLNIFSIQKNIYAAQSEAGRYIVSRVVDGDTFVLHDAGGQSFRVRLYGIDCPEDTQEAGATATARAAMLAQGKTVELLNLGRDRYRRTVAILYFADGSTIQAALLEAGVAWVTPRYCKRPECRDWKALEEASRQERRGLWQYPYPTPPWEWRKGNK